MAAGYANLTLEGYAHLTNESYAQTPLEGEETPSTSCPWTSAQITTILSALDTLQTVVAAIKAKTDLLPASPAATGDAMTLSAAYDAAKTAASASSISTLQTSVDAIPTTAYEIPTKAEIAAEVWGTTSRTITGPVTVESTQAATFVTATGFATLANVTSAKEAIIARGNEAWTTANVSSLATGAAISSLQSHGDALWATATGFATPSDLPNDYAKPADVQLTTTTQTVDLTGIARTADLADLAKKTDLPTDYAKRSDIPNDYATALNVSSILTSVSALPTASANASAVWGATSRTITGTVTVKSDQAEAFSAVTPATDISGLATSEEIATLQRSVNAIPTTSVPTAQEFWEYPTRSLSTANLIQGLRGGNVIALATNEEIETLASHGDSLWSTASGFATPDDVQGIVDNYEPDPLPIAERVWKYENRMLTTQEDIPGSVYCTRTDVERRWGIQNVSYWANTDNSQEDKESRINTQISWAIETASRRIDSDLSSSMYVTPFSPVPSDVRKYCAVLAGIELYSSRRMQETEDSNLINSAMSDYHSWIAMILNGGIIAGATLFVSEN